ncbi:hypothetical protein SprV_0501747800 [Sparganum proliferum]
MRQARDRQRESIALSGSNPGKSVANIFRHRSSSKRGHELPPLLNDNKVFLTDDTDKAELFSAFFAKHLATESDPAFHVASDARKSALVELNFSFLPPDAPSIFQEFVDLSPRFQEKRRIPQNRRMLDPKKGPIRKAVAAGRLPKLAF